MPCSLLPLHRASQSPQPSQKHINRFAPHHVLASPRKRGGAVTRKNSGDYRRDCSPSAPSMRFSALSLAPHHILASLVKGELLLPEKNSGDYRRDCSLSAPSMRFSAVSPALNLPPLSKGGGLTARHKLLLHCVCLQYICLFYLPNFSAVKTEGLLHRYPFAPHQPLPKPHYPLLRTTFLAYERSVGFASLQSLWAFNFGHPCPSLAKGSWIATRLLLIINCLAQRFKYI